MSTDVDNKEISRHKLENGLISLLSNSYSDVPIVRTYTATDKIMKLVTKYCRFKSHLPKSSHASKPFSAATAAVVGKQLIKKQSSSTVKSASGNGKVASGTKPSAVKHASTATKSSSIANVASALNRTMFYKSLLSAEKSSDGAKKPTDIVKFGSASVAVAKSSAAKQPPTATKSSNIANVGSALNGTNSAKPSKTSSIAKSTNAGKKSADVAKHPTNLVSSENLAGSSKSFNVNSTVRSLTSTTTSTCVKRSVVTAVKPQPKPSSVKKDAVIYRSVVEAERDELENELKRLSSSAGFVTPYPAKHKRVSKPVARFTISPDDNKRPRRAKRQYDKTDEVNEPTKKRAKENKNDTIYKTQSQTFSHTAATIGS